MTHGKLHQGHSGSSIFCFFKNIFSGQSVLSQAGWSGQSETTEEEEKCCSRSKSSSLMANYTGLRPGRPQTKVQTEIKVCLGKMLPRCVKQRITHAMDRLLFVCVCLACVCSIYLSGSGFCIPVRVHVRECAIPVLCLCRHLYHHENVHGSPSYLYLVSFLLSWRHGVSNLL